MLKVLTDTLYEPRTDWTSHSAPANLPIYGYFELNNSM